MDKSQTAKPEPQVRLCLISTPGPICDATCATLAHTAHVKLVAIASGALSATQLLQHVEADLVLLDTNLPEEEVHAMLQWLAGHFPTVRTLVTTLTSGRMHQALAFGADIAVRRDELPEKLKLFINHLIRISE